MKFFDYDGQNLNPFAKLPKKSQGLSRSSNNLVTLYSERRKSDRVGFEKLIDKISALTGKK